MAGRIVVLDAAGTLLELRRPVGETYAATAREAGLSLEPSALEEAFHRELRTAPPLAFGDLDSLARSAAERAWWRERAHACLTAAGAAEDPAFDDPAFDRFFDMAWERFAAPGPWRVPEDVRPGLRALRRRGHPLAVLSNWDGRLERLLDALGLGGYFARVVVSAGLPAAKPDVRAYEAARARLLDLGPAAPIMVGDRIDHDLEPALAAGWRAIWLDRQGRPAAGADERPSLPPGAARVESLRELAAHPLLDSA